MTTEILLKVEKLTRRFGGLTAVSNLSFDVQKGEILGLIGPNGAGKSTTFNCVSGFYPASEGRIEFLGEDISKMNTAQVCHKGLVRTFQHDSLLTDMTVYDNILIATFSTISVKSERVRRVHETAEILNLSDHLQEIAGNLPHGLQRMVSIAIAFATRPKLLCLDEPLTGLNQTEVGGALAIFRRIRDEFKLSILLVEHNMKAVMEICDRIVVLDHGIFLAAGSPLEIKQNPAVISAYLGKRA
ncbi:LivG ABC-type branched-chain amino acid transport systems, ATPase component [Burkholderiaceae bacterium]|jgi:branched-chain amino acid transport system ATP-binding protein